LLQLSPLLVHLLLLCLLQLLPQRVQLLKLQRYVTPLLHLLLPYLPLLVHLLQPLLVLQLLPLLHLLPSLLPLLLLLFQPRSLLHLPLLLLPLMH
jgi:hypothetical protein